MTSIFFHTTTIGILRIASHDDRLIGLSIVCADEASGRKQPQTPMETTLCAEVDAYLIGHLTNFSTPLLLKGTAFQKRVWDALMSVNHGETVSYQTIADKIQQKNAVRAVASAIGKNPVAIIVPCHRVVGKDGSLRGYAWGLEVKQRLLALEQKQILRLNAGE